MSESVILGLPRNAPPPDTTPERARELYQQGGHYFVTADGVRHEVARDPHSDYVTVDGVTYLTKEGLSRQRWQIIGTTVAASIATTIVGRIVADLMRGRRR